MDTQGPDGEKDYQQQHQALLWLSPSVLETLIKVIGLFMEAMNIDRVERTSLQHHLVI